VQLLAASVGATLARSTASQSQATFEQFFTRELSEQLALRPNLLDGHDADVSILFCDIRGFSRISERLGPAGTMEWIGDVMGELSDCVLAHSGVLVDYIGDELIAMWGAPVDQPDHATLSARAAVDMLAAVPRINERWAATLGEPMDLGIGINSGVARVGNTGSRHKFKYGPLGNTVNLASRVQGATKYVRSRILVTDATRSRMGAGFASRRVCQVRVVNIAEPVVLHELGRTDDAGWGELQQAYEGALSAFENRSFHEAAHLLGGLLQTRPDDGPSLLLLSRVANCLVSTDRDFNPCWELPGK
jgi:adenylate cyclase